MDAGHDGSRIVRRLDARRMPWKNGGGETIQIAVHPMNSLVDSFGWRISLARVDSDGFFSTFLGVDRSLTVLDGVGLSLAVGAGPPVLVTARDEPHRFPGEANCFARLLDGPVTALNAMVDRDAFACVVSRLYPARECRGLAGAVTVLVCVEGELETDLGLVGHHDALIVHAESAVRIKSRGAPARAVAATFRPLRRGGAGQG